MYCLSTSVTINLLPSPSGKKVPLLTIAVANEIMVNMLTARKKEELMLITHLTFRMKISADVVSMSALHLPQ